MPEGDTVFRTAAHLDRALRGRRLTRFELRVPRFAAADLSGEVVEEVVPVGKHLLHRIGGDATIHTHLKMEGSWHLYRPGERWRRPAHAARAVLEAEGVVAVGFDLGVVELLDRAEEHDAIGHLGPDPLGPGWDAQEAGRRLAADPAREIAAALLDQRSIAGLGNEYVVELCFLRGLDPRASMSEVTDPAGLAEAGRRLIRANRDRVERTTTGDTRRGRRTWVYGRQGEPCRRCGATILREPHGADPDAPERERVGFRCPACQPRR